MCNCYQIILYFNAVRARRNIYVVHQILARVLSPEYPREKSAPLNPTWEVLMALPWRREVSENATRGLVCYSRLRRRHQVLRLGAGRALVCKMLPWPENAFAGSLNNQSAKHKLWASKNSFEKWSMESLDFTWPLVTRTGGSSHTMPTPSECAVECKMTQPLCAEAGPLAVGWRLRTWRRTLYLLFSLCFHPSAAPW